MIKANGAPPALGRVQLGNHDSVGVAGQLRQVSRETCQAVGAGLHLPACFVDERQEALMAVQLEDVLELGGHRLSQVLRQGRRSRKQFVWFGPLNGGKVQVIEKAPFRKTALVPGIWRLPEEASRQSLSCHVSLPGVLSESPWTMRRTAVHCSTSASIIQRILMATTKTATVTFRIDPGVKEALRIAAAQDHRSIANMVEVMIRDYCGRNGIAIPEQNDLFEDTGNQPKLDT